MPKPRDRHFLDALLSNGEAVLDTFTDNELTRSIPVIGTAFKMLKGLDDLRSKALQSKLQKFLNSSGMERDSSAAAFRKIVEASPEEAETVGETLFLIIERLTDLEKPTMLAKVFLAYLENRISSGTLRRLAGAIDAAFIEDLNGLMEANVSKTCLQNLLHSGLAEINYTAVYGGFNSMDFRLSEHGKSLKSILL